MQQGPVVGTSTAACCCWEAFLWGHVGLKKRGLLAWYPILNAALNILKTNQATEGVRDQLLFPLGGIEGGLGEGPSESCSCSLMTSQQKHIAFKVHLAVIGQSCIGVLQCPGAVQPFFAFSRWLLHMTTSSILSLSLACNFPIGLAAP